MTYRTESCSFVLDPRGFVRATIDQGAEMDEKAAVEAVATTWRVAGERRTPVLVDMRGVVRETRECRQYFVSAEAERVCQRVALIVGTPLSRVIASFFVRLTAQPMPTRVFSSDEDAVEWLLQGVE